MEDVKQGASGDLEVDYDGQAQPVSPLTDDDLTRVSGGTIRVCFLIDIDR